MNYPFCCWKTLHFVTILQNTGNKNVSSVISLLPKSAGGDFRSAIAVWENCPLFQELADVSIQTDSWLPQAATYRLIFGLHSSDNKLDYLIFTDYPHSICTSAVCLLLIPLKYSPTLGLHFPRGNFLFISVEEEEEEMPLWNLEGFASNVWIPAAVCSWCWSTTGKLCLSLAGLWWPQGLFPVPALTLGSEQMCSKALNQCLQMWVGVFCKQPSFHA